MTNQIPLDLIGKHISEVPGAYTIETTNSSNGKIYMVDVSNEFLGKPYITIFVTTDKNDFVQSFTISINETINREFYDLMVVEYGEPYSMYKQDEIKFIESEIVKNDFFESRGRMTYKLKDCTFDEFPFIITWNKKGYDIQVIVGSKKDSFVKTRIIFGNVPVKEGMNK